VFFKFLRIYCARTKVYSINLNEAA